VAHLRPDALRGLIAVANARSADEVLRLLDYPAYFDLLEQPLPSNRRRHLSKRWRTMADPQPCEAGGWDITNLGAILFAKRLEDFPPAAQGGAGDPVPRQREHRDAERAGGTKGYACGFEGLVGYINGLLPANEVIGQALRKTVPMFPELAVRELVANALIHQDFFVTGAGPMVEIFDDRIEITNPGEPLVDTQRFVDTPPRLATRRSPR
jgi:ATP-dependent DNA helicase RecG